MPVVGCPHLCGCWCCCVAAFAAVVLSAVAGFGSGVLILRVFVAVLGTRDAVAVLTVAQLASNGSRGWINRREVDRRLVGVFVAGAIPVAIVGALVLTTASLAALTRVIGHSCCHMVVWPLRPRTWSVGDRVFAVVGTTSVA